MSDDSIKEIFDLIRKTRELVNQARDSVESIELEAEWVEKMMKKKMSKKKIEE